MRVCRTELYRKGKIAAFYDTCYINRGTADPAFDIRFPVVSHGSYLGVPPATGMYPYDAAASIGVPVRVIREARLLELTNWLSALNLPVKVLTNCGQHSTSAG